uniref:Uncharacterized protein n=1 Tax=Oryza sativa subsp. japonica TaxID=39947 RepID=Q69T52_ORYSJ|nr:hypothetical protein [Oryza sativa Japonica Group]
MQYIPKARKMIKSALSNTHVAAFHRSAAGLAATDVGAARVGAAAFATRRRRVGRRMGTMVHPHDRKPAGNSGACDGCWIILAHDRSM